jgi:hypothetical protein
MMRVRFVGGLARVFHADLGDTGLRNAKVPVL